MTTPVLYPRPAELARLPPGRSAVIEASAGTGKTYLLEHLVLDRLIDSDLRIEDILVVTFTDKGAAELSRRLRAGIDRLLAAAEGGPVPAAAAGAAASAWRLDAAAVARLRRARQSFDRATIATMHGFCQRVLTEFPFASQRLFNQRHVDSRQIFGQVFRDVLRRRLATEPELRPYLTAWLETGKRVDDLETLLYDARRFTSEPAATTSSVAGWAVSFDPLRISAAARDFLGIVGDGAAVAATKAAIKGPTGKASADRLEQVAALCRTFVPSGDVPVFLRDLELAVNEKADLFSQMETKVGPGPFPPLVRQTIDAFLSLADAAVPLGVAVAQRFAPLVNQALEAHKRQTGVFDFEDMLTLVAEGLAGPHGDDLTRALRDRYRCALIDEFQDTDPTQWRIFRRLFLDSQGANPLVIVGDPKQAIYGFRGADVQTYLGARQTVSGDGGAAVYLERNFRSTRGIVDAYNAILDQTAADPFFDAAGAIHYDHPVALGRAPDAANDAGPAAGPAVTLLSVVPTRPGDMRARDVRRSLAERIVREIRALLDGPRPVPAGEIFILTRTGAEGEYLGRPLLEAGIPFTFFKQDGLYQTAEARHVVDLLTAINDPHDRGKRLRAWMTPFFGLALGDLPACAALPADHPLLTRLLAWKDLADGHRYQQLFHRILDDSGVIRRELCAGAGQRRLTNYQHLFDLLLAETTKGRRSLRDLALQLGAFSDSSRKPDPEDGNVQRRESDGDSVQIMTMHKAKGLEADVVFLFGGFTAWRAGRRLRVFARDGQRVAYAGKPRRLAIEVALKAEQSQEDQRLLYVALTRARARLFLPYFGSLPAADEELDAPMKELESWKKLTGGYRHVNRRLRALVEDPVFRDPRHVLFAATTVPCPPELDGDAREATADARRRALAEWTPPPALLVDDAATRASALATVRRRHAGFTVTSYTRIKQAHGGYQAPQDRLDDGLGTELDAAEAANLAATATDATDVHATDAPAPADAAALPGGAESGIFLHAALEAVPLATLAGRPPLDDWAALPVVRALFTQLMRRFDRSPDHRADAQRLVHAALTTPLALTATRTLAGGLVDAARVLREVEFVYPAPAARPGDPSDAPCDFVKGFIDLVFEDEGRTYLGDWKSDRLPAWDPSTLAAHVTANYGLQARLYALALYRMLGIASPSDYDARFGGMLFVFVRGLPEAVFRLRPSWDEITAWREQLAATVAPASGGHRDAEEAP